MRPENKKFKSMILLLMHLLAVLNGLIVAFFSLGYSMCHSLWWVVSLSYLLFPLIASFVNPKQQRILASLFLIAALLGIYLSFLGSSFPQSFYDAPCVVWSGFLPADLIILLLFLLPALVLFRVSALSLKHET